MKKDLKQVVSDMGYDLRIEHFRTVLTPDGLTEMTPHEIRLSGLQGLIKPRSGTTRVTLERGGRVVATGVALCGPKDNFSRTLGVTIALGRAMKDVKDHPCNPDSENV